MNILILNWKDIKNPNRGGAEVIAFEFAKRLVKEGHSVTFFSRSFKGASPEETIDGVKIIRRGNIVSVYVHAYLYYKSLKTKPDKVIDMVNTICWQTPLYIPKNKRVMYVNQLAQEVFFYELPFPLSAIAFLLERLEYQTYKNTNVICYSKSTQADLHHFGVPLRNIHIFPMGLDHKRYYEGHTKSKKPLFLFVARLVKMKRAALCIDAMKLLVEKKPDVELVIIGNGPEEENILSQIKKYGLQTNIQLITQNNFYLNKNSHDVKIDYMQKAWALLLPSVKEGWGMVVTEAAACGTPSIVSKVTGLRDSVIKDKTGLVLSAKPTPVDLALAMETIIDKKINKKLSENAKKWAKNFDWNTSYLIFKKLLLQ